MHIVGSKAVFLIFVLACFFGSLMFEGGTAKADDPSPNDIRELNNALSMLGYDVEPNGTELTQATIASTNRAARRRAGEVSDFPRFLEELKTLNSPEDFPCVPGVKDSRQESRDVSITFWGNLPEEYLAYFYLRLARCYPDLLRGTMGAAGEIRPQASEDKSLPAFPVHRTARSVEVFNQVRDVLGGDPATDVSRELDLLGTTVTSCEGAKDETESCPPPFPTREDMRLACAAMGYAGMCMETSQIEPKFVRWTDKPVSYVAAVPHFKLVLKMRLPEALLDEVFIDAVDFARSKHEVLQDERIFPVQLPMLDMGEVSYPNSHTMKVCVQNGKDIFCTEQDKVEFAENIDTPQERIKKIRKLIGYTDDCDRDLRCQPKGGSLEGRESTQLAAKESANVIIADPGFTELGNKSFNYNIDGCKEDDKREICYLEACDNSLNMCSMGHWRTLSDALISGAEAYNTIFGGDHDGLEGHGLHVGGIIGGGEKEKDIFYSAPFAPATGDEGYDPNKPNKLSIGFAHNFATRYFETDAHLFDMLLDASKPNSKAKFKANVFNMSFGETGLIDGKTVNCPSSKKSVGLLNFSKVLQEENYLDPRKAVFIISAPYKCRTEEPDMLGKFDPCNREHDTFSFCGLRFKNVLGVAPVAEEGKGFGIFDSDKYMLDVTEEYMANSTYDTETHGGMLWIGAPGVDIWSTDLVSAVNGSSAYRDQGKKTMTPALTRRSGSSMAAPIVTSLVVRLQASKQNLNIEDIKSWVYANASHIDLPNSHNSEKNLVGMVNFARSLRGNPAMVNLWEKGNKNCEEDPCQAGELKVYSLIIAHKSIYEFLVDGSNKHILSVFRGGGGEKIYALLLANSCPEGKEGHENCFSWVKKDSASGNKAIGCDLFDVENSNRPCFKVVYFNQSNERFEEKVDFGKTTHLVSINKSQWTCPECASGGGNYN